MTTYTLIEKENSNSQREGVTFTAKNLRGAKIAASKRQVFCGTFLELVNEHGHTVACKEKDGNWFPQEMFNA